MRYTLCRSVSGMKVASGAVRRPAAWRNISRKAWATSKMPKKLAMRWPAAGGRMAMISGSRPTMIVSVWWRVWLQRQTVGSRMIMKQARL